LRTHEVIWKILKYSNSQTEKKTHTDMICLEPAL